jgi:hypothetical protein
MLVTVTDTGSARALLVILKTMKASLVIELLQQLYKVPATSFQFEITLALGQVDTYSTTNVLSEYKL